MSSTQSSKQLALKGKKAAFDMVRAMNKLEVATKDIFFKLFYSQIQPSWLYASEVWGLLVTDDHVEKVLHICMQTISECFTSNALQFCIRWIGKNSSRNKLLYSVYTILV